MARMRKRPADGWQEFREADGEAIGIEELKCLSLQGFQKMFISRCWSRPAVRP